LPKTEIKKRPDSHKDRPLSMKEGVIIGQEECLRIRKRNTFEERGSGTADKSQKGRGNSGGEKGAFNQKKTGGAFDYKRARFLKMREFSQGKDQKSMQLVNTSREDINKGERIRRTTKIRSANHGCGRRGKASLRKTPERK